MDIGGEPLARPLRQGLAQRRDQREQFGREDMAFAHVDDGVRCFRAEPEQHLPALAFGMERGAAAAARRREVRSGDDIGDQPLPLGGRNHPVADEIRKCLLGQMLKLARAAGGEVAARRGDMLRAGSHRPVLRDHVARRGQRDVTPAWRHPVALGGDPQDCFRLDHARAAPTAP